MFRHHSKKMEVSVSVLSSSAKEVVSAYFQIMAETGLGYFLMKFDELSALPLNSTEWFGALSQLKIACDHYDRMSELRSFLSKCGMLSADSIITINASYLEAVNFRFMIEPVKRCEAMLNAHIEELNHELRRGIAFLGANHYPDDYYVMMNFDFLLSRVLYCLILCCLSDVATSFSKNQKSHNDASGMGEALAPYFFILFAIKFFSDQLMFSSLRATLEELKLSKARFFSALSFDVIEAASEKSGPQFYHLTLSNVEGLFGRGRRLAIEAPQEEDDFKARLSRQLSPVRPHRSSF
ncbi:MAG TPA: hypothetical protein VFU82_00075 [Gammaproteobacteria bacterium]|jgi:hypothetical protein|nr:hypothetical protein [Gammaproteobacteria bacterium]